MASADRKTQQKQQLETLARLTAPAHVSVNRFEEHKRVEGYFEDRQVPDFMGCDRLLKWDTLHGTIQLGYSPRRRQPFLFANIKTSLYDHAASRHQRRMNEEQRVQTQKGSNPNLAYSSRRRWGSSVLLYNRENRPWSAGSIRPYLRRANLEALGKAMPFLQPEQELAARKTGMRRDRELSREESASHGVQQAHIRAERVALGAQQSQLEAILCRKEAGTRLFFRRINLVYDLQKQAIFTHYRSRRERLAQEADNLIAQPPEEEETY